MDRRFSLGRTVGVIVSATLVTGWGGLPRGERAEPGRHGKPLYADPDGVLSFTCAARPARGA